MKISITEQVAEAERHRDELAAAIVKRPELSSRLDAAEGLLLTARFNQAYEPDFRQFMASRSNSR